MTDKPKLLILGYGRHGKDTVAELLQDDYGFKFTSSSLFVAQEVMWDIWGVAKYATFDEMFADRSNHRVLWMEMISAYNTPDKTKTATTMLERGFDLYVGMRRLDELEACKAAKIFDAIIWVDASDRHPPETGSMDITRDNANPDFVIDNNGPEENLQKNVSEVMRQIKLWYQSSEFMKMLRDAPPLFDNMFTEDGSEFTITVHEIPHLWEDGPEAPNHPWDHMSPVEQLADWLGADVDELAEIENRSTFPVPVRTGPEAETLNLALDSLGLVIWYDAKRSCMVAMNTDTPETNWRFEAVCESIYQVGDSLFVWFDETGMVGGASNTIGGCKDRLSEYAASLDDDPWTPALEAMALSESGPEFVSKRTVAGQVSVTETSANGATTIINIENVYLTDKD